MSNGNGSGRMSVSSDLALLIIRVALGVVYIAHGSQKFGIIGDGNIGQVVNAWQEGMGIPPFLTYIAALTELLGGVAIVLGVLARFFAVGLVILQVVAIYKVHWSNGFFISGAVYGWEYGFVLLLSALAIAVAGPGRYAIVDFEARILGSKG